MAKLSPLPLFDLNHAALPRRFLNKTGQKVLLKPT